MAILPSQRLVKRTYIKYVDEASFLPFQTRNAAGTGQPGLMLPPSLSPLSHPAASPRSQGLQPAPQALSASLKPGTLHPGAKGEPVLRDGLEVQTSSRVGESNSSLHKLTVDFIIICPSAKATRLITFRPPLSAQGGRAPLGALHQRYHGGSGLRGALLRAGGHPGRGLHHRPASRFIYYPSIAFPAARVSCWPPARGAMVPSSSHP